MRTLPAAIAAIREGKPESRAMRIFRYTILGLWLIGCLPAVWRAAAAEPLRIGTEGTYRPWTMADADGRVTGFDADIAQSVCRKIGAQCSFVVQNFDSLIPSLMRGGRFELIFSSLSISASRRRQIDFSVPYAQMQNLFVVRKDSPLAAIKDKAALFAALKGKRLGVQNATTHAFYAEKHISGADLRSYDTFDDVLMDLANGRLDAAFADTAIWSAYLAKPENSRRFAYVDVVIPMADDPATLGGGVAAGLPKGADALRLRINQALCALAADGTVKRLGEKWFNGSDVSVPCAAGAVTAAP